MENTTKQDWDILTIQISKEGIPGSGKMTVKKADIETMSNLHGVERGEILEMLLQALETTENNTNS